jgi:hypothetical protein
VGPDFEPHNLVTFQSHLAENEVRAAPHATYIAASTWLSFGQCAYACNFAQRSGPHVAMQLRKKMRAYDCATTACAPVMRAKVMDNVPEDSE